MNDLATPYFLARPTSSAAAGVIVLQEGGGITSQLMRLCERLAMEGYAVAAPELFFRTGGPAAKPAPEQALALQQPEMLDDVAFATRALRELGVVRIGVVGFCMGGSLAWHVARQVEGCDAAVAFYGADIASDLGELRCPTLVFFGGSDQWIPSENIAAVAAHHADTVIYPEAGHAFMHDGSEKHVEEAAADAWNRMLQHLRRYLTNTDSSPSE